MVSIIAMALILRDALRCRQRSCVIRDWRWARMRWAIGYRRESKAGDRLFFKTKIRFVTLATKIFKNNSKMILVVDVAMLHLPWLVYL